MKTLFYLSILYILSICTVVAQDTTYVDSAQIADTILYQPKGFEFSAVGVTDSVNYEKQLYQNPTAALFKSMLVPGLGQVGNHQYIKAGIVIGLQTWFISSAVKHGKDASDFKNQFNSSTDITERNYYYGQYLDSKDQRNKFTWFAVIVTFVSMFDAYADAHLSGFPDETKNSNSDLGLNITPSSDDGLYASVTYSF